MTNPLELTDRRYLKLLGIALLIGIGYDLLFYDKAYGISYPLFTAIYFAYLFRGLPQRFSFRLDFSIILLVSVVLLSMTFALFANPVLKGLNIIAVPLLMAMYVEQSLGLNEGEWKLQRVLYAVRRLIIRGIGSMPTAIRIPLVHIRKRSDVGRYQTVVKVLIGLLISLPMVIIAVSLLSSADKLFEQILFRIPNWFENVPVGEFIWRLFVVLIVTCYTFGLTWSFIRDITRKEAAANRSEAGETEESAADPKHTAIVIDPIISATVLVSINLVYVLFTAVQFVYLFGGGQGVLPDGMTYAEYARRGFGEMVLVTVINFGLILGVFHTSPIGKGSSGKIIRLLLMLLMANTAVMLVSSYVRLTMYEAAYGYTYTRFFVHAFLLWLGAMLALMLWKIIRPQKALLRTAFILTLAAYLALNYVNVDARIAENNLERYANSGRVDWGYLNDLSADAVPALVAFEQASEGIPELVRGFERKQEQLAHDDSWASFNIAKFRANRLIKEY
jgi:hypothetical protein